MCFYGSLRTHNEPLADGADVVGPFKESAGAAQPHAEAAVHRVDDGR